MTLERWLRGWKYAGQNWRAGSPDPMGATPDGVSAFVVPDDPFGHTRTWAWGLEDYRVSSVTGGSIWFTPKGRGPKGEA